MQLRNYGFIIFIYCAVIWRDKQNRFTTITIIIHWPIGDWKAFDNNNTYIYLFIFNDYNFICNSNNKIQNPTVLKWKCSCWREFRKKINFAEKIWPASICRKVSAIFGGWQKCQQTKFDVVETIRNSIQYPSIRLHNNRIIHSMFRTTWYELIKSPLHFNASYSIWSL